MSSTEALFNAIYEERFDKVVDALYEGADVNAVEDKVSGYTPLTLILELGAGGNECEKIIRELCNHGASPHLANAWGATPLLSAVSMKQTQWAKLFLAQGAEVNVRGVVDERLSSPLHEAAFWGLYDMMEWLVQAGAITDMHAHKGMQPQAYARTNPVNGPIELMRVGKALKTLPHPIMSLWRHPVDMKHVRFDPIDTLERLPTNWCYRLNEALKNKDWYNATLAIEMGAITSDEVAERIREMRYTSV